MKKIILVIAVVLAVVGCKGDCDCPDVGSSGRSPSVTCTEPVNQTIQQQGPNWCDDDDIYRSHSISASKFKALKKAHWNSSTDNKIIYWYDIEKLIGNHTCYDKYVQFVFDTQIPNNSSISIQLSDCYYERGSCYSIPLLMSIKQEHNLKPEDQIECTIADDGSGKIVIFRVSNKTLVPSFSHFDVSDFPKFINKLAD